MTHEEYEAHELQRFHRQMREVERATLADRRDGRDSYAEVVSNAEHMAERSRWLLDGCYGYGSMVAARATAKNKRMNRAAYFGQLIAALDHGCPYRYAVEAFKALPRATQDRVNAAIEAEIDEVMSAIEAGQR